MKKLLICSAVLLQSLCAGTYAQQNFSGGTGTESDPYLVSKLADLQQISGGVITQVCFLRFRVI